MIPIDISVVIPTFNSAKSLKLLVNRTKSALSEGSEILLVDDASTDESWEMIQILATETPGVRGIRLSRNSGQHGALLAGIREARKDVIATIDDDLQNPPEELQRLVSSLSPEIDVVYGVPTVTSHPRWRVVSSLFARKTFIKSLGIASASEISSFRVFRRRLRDSFHNELGPGVSIDALLDWATTRIRSVEVAHHQRVDGKSNYSLGKLAKLMLDTATGYSTVPLRFASGLGFVTVALSIGFLLWVVGRPLVTGESVPGFPFVAATIAIFSGVQLIVLGILGQYIGRMHFRVMNKPTYTIADRTDRISE